MCTNVISIIVPVYNAEDYLDKCVQHVVHQSYQLWELILIDDGSQDSSSKICDNYARLDSRINVIHQNNLGVSQARNTGLDYATGRFVLFCDADDWMDENALEFYIREQSKNDADIVFGDINNVKNGKNQHVRLFNQNFNAEGKEICRKIIRACIGYGYNPFPTKPYSISGLGSVGNKIYKLSIIRDHHIKFTDETNGIYEDNLFTMQYLSKIDKVCYKSECVYYYRQTEGSSVHRYRPESLITSKKIFDKVSKFIDNQEDSLLYKRAFHILVIRRLSEELRVYYFHNDNPQTTRESCKELRKKIHTETYLDAIRNVELTRLLPVHKATALIARLGSAYLLWLFYKFRTALKTYL